MSKYVKAIRMLAKHNALDADVTEKLLKAHMEEDGGPGSGNFGHKGRPGKRGGSSKEGGGSASGSSGEGRASYGSSQSGGAAGTPSGKTGQGVRARKIRVLSPFHEKRSVATRDAGTLKKLQGSMGNPDAMKKELDGMKPGAMIRLGERGYSVFEKKKDGSWAYQKYHGGESPVEIGDVIASIQKTNVRAVSVPKAGESGRSQYWDDIRAVADLEPNAGDDYTGKRVTFKQALKNGALRAQGVLAFPKDTNNVSAEYTKMDVGEDGVIHSCGKPTELMPNGTGVTPIKKSALFDLNPDDNVYNTLQEHCMENANGDLVLTPEREKLHQDAIEELFENAVKPGPGEEKVVTFMGGGSAAGKGTIQKAGVANLPDKEHSPVIDPDEMKKRIPEYVDTAFSEDHNKAASMGHEESSAMAARAYDAAIANGYNCTIDGTGDGRPEKMIAKIRKAQANGYKVRGCYVTCPTDIAVDRNAKRSTTDEYNRYVPEGEVRRIHAKVSQNFERIAEAMDYCALYDTNQPGGPKLICEYKKGKRTIHDQKLYKDFINKGKEIS